MPDARVATGVGAVDGPGAEEVERFGLDRDASGLCIGRPFVFAYVSGYRYRDPPAFALPCVDASLLLPRPLPLHRLYLQTRRERRLARPL